MMSSASWCEKKKSKIFKDNKIVRALKANTICSLKNKIFKCLLTREIMLSLVDNLHEKKHRKRS